MVRTKSETMDRPVDEQVEQFARAIAVQPNAIELYYQLAEAHWRAGDMAGYANFFRRAYLAGAHRLRIPLPRFGSADAPVELRDRTSALAGQGVAYTAVLSTLALAEARLGNDAAVTHLMDYERFLRVATIEPPDGASLEAFNSALAHEIRSDLTYYDSPPDQALRHAWRYDAIEKSRLPNIRKLTKILRRCVSDYMRELPAGAAHPFIAMSPARYEIGGSAVVSRRSSYLPSHIHRRAWATVVYYVREPEVSKSPGSRDGWLTVGPPEALGEAPNPGWERRDIEPVPGSVVLMPGYFWHETQPMEVDQERICVAFEVYPQELWRGAA